MVVKKYQKKRSKIKTRSGRPTRKRHRSFLVCKDRAFYSGALNRHLNLFAKLHAEEDEKLHESKIMMLKLLVKQRKMTKICASIRDVKTKKRRAKIGDFALEVIEALMIFGVKFKSGDLGIFEEVQYAKRGEKMKQKRKRGEKMKQKRKRVKKEVDDDETESDDWSQLYEATMRKNREKMDMEKDNNDNLMEEENVSKDQAETSSQMDLEEGNQDSAENISQDAMEITPKIALEKEKPNERMAEENISKGIEETVSQIPLEDNHDEPMKVENISQARAESDLQIAVDKVEKNLKTVLEKENQDENTTSAEIVSKEEAESSLQITEEKENPDEPVGAENVSQKKLEVPSERPVQDEVIDAENISRDKADTISP